LSLIYGFFFFIVGLILLGLGLWITNIKGKVEGINNMLSVPALIVLIVGGVVIFVAILGIIGVIRENLCLLRFFLAIIIIAFIAQVVVGVLAFIYRNETKEITYDQLDSAMEYYFEDNHLKKGVDYVQSNFGCCGLNGPADWDRNANFSCSNLDSPLNCAVPESCCVEQTDECLTLASSSVRRKYTASRLNRYGFYSAGCTEKFLEWLTAHLDATGAIAMGFAVLHILGIFFVYMFSSKVEDYKKLFKYRKRIYETE
jgi:ABC-type transport system involved in multi-copper enzyme maturation permease subunit